MKDVQNLDKILSLSYRLKAAWRRDDRPDGKWLRGTDNILYLVGLSAGQGSWLAAPPGGIRVSVGSTSSGAWLRTDPGVPGTESELPDVGSGKCEGHDEVKEFTDCMKLTPIEGKF